MNPPSIEEQTPGEAHLDKTRLQATAPEPPAQQSLFAAPAVAPSDAGVEAAGRLAMRRMDTLKPHPSLLKLSHWPPEEQLLALEKLGEAIFEAGSLPAASNAPRCCASSVRSQTKKLWNGSCKPIAARTG
jgi:hypothetical protein